jgi:pentatricopeptide repeat protein
VIDGLGKAGNTDKAMELLNVMVNKGMSPNTIIYSSIACALSTEGRMNKVIQLFDNIQDATIRTDAVLYNAVIFPRSAKEGKQIVPLSFLLI